MSTLKENVGPLTWNNGTCRVGLGARTDHAFETNWNTNAGLTIFLLGSLVATAYLLPYHPRNNP